MLEHLNQQGKRLIHWARRDPDITLSMDDRVYRLGDTVSVDIEVVSKKDFEIYEGRVDLIHQREYTENVRMMVPDYMSNRIYMRNSMIGSGRTVKKIMIPKRVTQDFKDRFHHSSTSFLKEASMQVNGVYHYSIDLGIQKYTPPHCGEGNTKWLVSVALELPNGREVIREDAVRISLV